VPSLLKTWLVLLLALILPLKGAVAAAGVLCHATPTPIALQTAQAAVHAVAHHGMGHGAQRSPAAHGTHPRIAADTGSDGHASDSTDRYLATGAASSVDTACPACAGICAASPLPVSHTLSLATDPVARARPGTAHIAPPSHVAAGLERPPRSV